MSSGGSSKALGARHRETSVLWMGAHWSARGDVGLYSHRGEYRVRYWMCIEVVYIECTLSWGIGPHLDWSKWLKAAAMYLVHAEPYSTGML